MTLLNYADSSRRRAPAAADTESIEGTFIKPRPAGPRRWPVAAPREDPARAAWWRAPWRARTVPLRTTQRRQTARCSTPSEPGPDAQVLGAPVLPSWAVNSHDPAGLRPSSEPPCVPPRGPREARARNATPPGPGPGGTSPSRPGGSREGRGRASPHRGRRDRRGHGARCKAVLARGAGSGPLGEGAGRAGRPGRPENALRKENPAA
jgi:hypothetical protein